MKPNTPISPYYQDEAVTIYHGDCLDVFSAVGWMSDHTLISDPPYGFGFYPTDVSPQRNLLKRWLGSHDSVALFAYPELLVSWCVAVGRTPDEWITWWPTNGSMKSGLAAKNSGILPRECECIAVFGHATWGRLRRERTGAMHLYPWRRKPEQQNAPSDARMGDVWVDASPGLGVHHAKRHHPNEKPLGVMHRLVEALTEPGDVILDPYAGSGTTLLAAKNLGRRAVGIEIEERYCNIAVARCSQEVMEIVA